MLVQSVLLLAFPSLKRDRDGKYAVLQVLISDLSGDSSHVFKGSLLAAATPSPSPSIVSSDSASALPSWLLVALFILVVFIVVAMFALTSYNLTSAYRALGRVTRRYRGNPPSQETLNSPLVTTLATSSQPGTGTTRTTLAVVGLSLLGVAVIAVFGLSGQGVRDLRDQVIGALTTLVAAIAGFYFGARTAQSSAAAAAPTASGPAAADPAVTGPAVTGPAVTGPAVARPTTA
jgi:hypothetical protein